MPSAQASEIQTKLVRINNSCLLIQHTQRCPTRSPQVAAIRQIAEVEEKIEQCEKKSKEVSRHSLSQTQIARAVSLC